MKSNPSVLGQKKQFITIFKGNTSIFVMCVFLVHFLLHLFQTIISVPHDFPKTHGLFVPLV